MIALARPNNIVEFPQKSNEWYTPARYIEAAREVMGGIDLDPASCEVANQTVRAARYFTEQDDGLSKAWHGRVWLNPPYGRTPQMRGAHLSTIKFFVDKLLESYHLDVVSQAVLLTTCRIDTAWFQPLWEYPICFANHKVGFYCTKTGKTLQEQCHTLGTVFVYLGPHEHKFIDVFSQFGTIAKRVSQPKVQYVNLSLWETLK